MRFKQFKLEILKIERYLIVNKKSLKIISPLKAVSFDLFIFFAWLTGAIKISEKIKDE